MVIDDIHVKYFETRYICPEISNKSKILWYNVALSNAIYSI